VPVNCRLLVGDGAKPKLSFEPALPATAALIAANADAAGRTADALVAGDATLRDAEGSGDGRRSAANGRLGDKALELGSPEAAGGTLASLIARGEPCRSRSSALELPRRRLPAANAPVAPA
jgi:hypothetical protein